MRIARKNPFISKLKGNIRRELKHRGKTINWLCLTMGVNRMYISQLREGSPIRKIIDIANTIGCSPAELLYDI